LLKERIISEIMLALLLAGTLSPAFYGVTFTMDQASLIDLVEGMGKGESLAQWNKTYGGPDYDWAESVIQTSDGGYALVGCTRSFGAGSYDFWLIKTDANGDMEWNKTYGGTNMDVAESIIQTSDGGYALAGRTGPRNYYDFWFVKTDADGNMEWNKTFGGTSDDMAHSLIQTVDGGYALAGYTGSFGAGESDFWLIKTDANGNVQWNKTYGYEFLAEMAYSVIQSNDGGYVMAGVISEYPNWDSAYFWLVKTDMNGNMEWERDYGDGSPHPWYIANSVVQTSDGGYALAGSFDFYLVKTDPRGIPQWDRKYEGPYSDYAQSMVQTPDGGYALAGRVEWFDGEGDDFWLVKTDANGNMEWHVTYGGAEYDDALSVIQASDGGYVLAGRTDSFGAGGADAWLVKFVPYHDIVLVNMTPSKTAVGQGFQISINVTVENQGFYMETFNVTAYIDLAPPIGDEITLRKQTTTNLPIGETRTVQFQWDTTGLAKGNYTISAIADIIDDIDATDNTYIDGTVVITILGDVNGDFTVDIFDLVAVAAWFGSTIPPAPPNSDIIEDKLIDIYDLVTVAIHYGEADP
jgi:hypothetical protein